MLANYLKISFRNLIRYRTYAIINIGGLAVGICCSILVSLYVLDALSYDRHHSNADHIFRLIQTTSQNGEVRQQPFVSPLAGDELVEQFPDVQQAVRLGFTAPVRLGRNKEYIVPEGSETWYASSKMFDVFSFEIVSCDPITALASPYSIVLTRSLADRLFGDVDPIGKSLDYHVFGRDEELLKVTGILEDIPSNSHLRFECLISFATLEAISGEKYSNDPTWKKQNTLTYLLLKDAKEVNKLERGISSFVNSSRRSDSVGDITFKLQKLTDIHLHSTHLNSDRAVLGDIDLILILLAIAIIILLVACINYVNLATAQSVRRAKEIGIRKSLGAKKRDLVFQFLAESVLMTLVGLAIGLLLVETALPLYNTVVGKDFAIDYSEVWFYFLGMGLILGILSGAYPALHLTVFQSSNVLAARSVRGNFSQALRKALVVTQFCAASVLLISTGIVWSQLRYIQEKDLGIEQNQILYTSIPSSRSSGNQAFIEDLYANPNVLTVARAVVRPLYDMQSFPKVDAVSSHVDEAALTPVSFSRIDVGYNFTEVFGIDLVAGRTFSRDRITDQSEAAIINEKALLALGWTNSQDAIGKKINLNAKSRIIIGVLKDFNFESLHTAILPFVMVYNKHSPMVFVKVNGQDLGETIAHIQQKWEQYATTVEPFKYNFMSEFYEQEYSSERRLQTVLFTFSLLGIFMTCLGVFGLTSFMMEQRKKEISVRKVLGASTSNIMILLTRNYLRLATVALISAFPLAYYITEDWLQDFAYRVDTPWTIFVFAGIVVLSFTLVSVLFQSLKAARTNPIKNINSEAN